MRGTAIVASAGALASKSVLNDLCLAKTRSGRETWKLRTDRPASGFRIATRRARCDHVTMVRNAAEYSSSVRE